LPLTPSQLATVIPAHADPVRGGFSVQSLASLEYWVARSFCAKTRFALLPGDDD
jgi:hypothetical protein